jgi:hypothetical protein
MSLLKRIANKNHTPERTIAALRLIQTQLKCELSQRKAWAGPNSAEDRSDGRGNATRRTKLLDRVARSNGDPKRTISALRLSIETLERELGQHQAAPVLELFLANLLEGNEVDMVKGEADEQDNMTLGIGIK